MVNNYQNTSKRAIVLYTAIALLLFSTLFVSHSDFIEARIVP